MEKIRVVGHNGVMSCEVVKVFYYRAYVYIHIYVRRFPSSPFFSGPVPRNSFVTCFALNLLDILEEPRKSGYSSGNCCSSTSVGWRQRPLRKKKKKTRTHNTSRPDGDENFATAIQREFPPLTLNEPKGNYDVDGRLDV